jgi:hypothetical protein
MQEPIKQHQAKEMHKYVLGLLGVWLLFLITAPIASLRVSQDQKFANVGFHVKSWTLEGKVAKLKDKFENKMERLTDKLSKAKSKISNLSPQTFKDRQTNNLALVKLPKASESRQTLEFAQIPEITDPQQLAALNQKLYQQIAQDLPIGRKFEQKLVYQVKVNQDGAIAHYEPLNQAALENLPQTPLPNLPIVNASNSQQPVGNFEVVFTPRGVLEVTPWQGWQK